MSIRTLTTKEVKFVPECQEDVPAANQAYVMVRNLSQNEYAQIQDSEEYRAKNLSQGEDEGDFELVLPTRTGTINKEILRFCVKNMVNFTDEDANGKEIPYIFQKPLEGETLCNPANLDKMPSDIRNAVSAFIDKGCRISEADSKNSG